MERVCVYCGSSPGDQPRYAEQARAFGRALAEAGIGLVYGGGNVGLMGAVAEGAIDAGGEVIGIIPQFLEAREVAYRDPRVDLRVVGSMHERKAQMAELADAFVALPGGFGTFEEFFEIVTWVQLGLVRAPCILLNLDGYYDALVALIDGAAGAAFINQRNRAIVETYPSIDDVLRRLRNGTRAAPPRS
jgi:hypothetical protein